MDYTYEIGRLTARIDELEKLIAKLETKKRIISLLW